MLTTQAYNNSVGVAFIVNVQMSHRDSFGKSRRKKTLSDLGSRLYRFDGSAYPELWLVRAY